MTVLPVLAPRRKGPSGSIKALLFRYFKKLPDAFQVSALVILGILRRPLRRPHVKSVRQMPNGFIAIWCSDGLRYTNSLHRVSRYSWGIEHRNSLMRCRYTLPGFVDFDIDDVVFDVGANVGEFALAACNFVKRVYAFEPDQDIFELLRSNTADVQNITPVMALLWNRVEEVPFRSDPRDANSSVLFAGDSGRVSDIRLASTLDVQRRILKDSPSFIKMDAEGAEPEALQGGLAVLQFAQKVAIDCGPERLGQSTDAAVVDIFESLGFTTKRSVSPCSENIIFGLREA